MVLNVMWRSDGRGGNITEDGDFGSSEGLLDVEVDAEEQERPQGDGEQR
jgi:hypothetical protein